MNKILSHLKKYRKEYIVGAICLGVGIYVGVSLTSVIRNKELAADLIKSTNTLASKEKLFEELISVAPELADLKIDALEMLRVDEGKLVANPFTKQAVVGPAAVLVNAEPPMTIVAVIPNR